MTRRRLPSPGSAALSPSSPPNPYPRSDPSWAPPRRGGRSCRPSAPGSSLSLSDDASAEIASKLSGQVAKIKPSWTVTESAQQAQVSLLSGRAGGSKGSVGTSKSFREQREALFQPREFGLLPNCQAICLPYDGTHATSAVRVYLKPYYLPETMPYWRAVEAGKI